MTLTDFVWVAVGETLLAGTFALGILVGISLSKRISHDDRNERKTPDYWHNAGNANSAGRSGGGNQGGADSGHSANHAKRPPR
jgi:hypothetical protein